MNRAGNFGSARVQLAARSITRRWSVSCVGLPSCIRHFDDACFAASSRSTVRPRGTEGGLGISMTI